ncbi:MAG: hypothetical protein N4A38_02600 [Candidatus Gracilibacteria bacterium]|nr:hypothetical protein [Candidatus Gracilibacteria bacterium]
MKFSKNNKHNSGYIILLALVIIGLLGIVFLSSINVLSSSFNYLEVLKLENSNINKNNNLSLDIGKNNHSGSVDNKVINCNGNIKILEGALSATCLTIGGETPPAAVDINYTLDNNDYKCSYTSDYSKVDSSSTKQCDDDDIHRKKIIGSIGSGDIKTSFSINDKIMEIIENNTNNSGDNISVKLPKKSGVYNNFKIKINALSGNINNLNMSFYIADKTVFNNKKEIKLLDKKITKTGIENTLLDVENKDYYLNFENTGNENIIYEITALSDGEDIYIVPFDDSKADNYMILDSKFINLSGEYIYFGEEKYYDKS